MGKTPTDKEGAVSVSSGVLVPRRSSKRGVLSVANGKKAARDAVVGVDAVKGADEELRQSFPFSVAGLALTTDLSSKEAARATKRVLIDVATDAGNAVNDEKPPVKIIVGNKEGAAQIEAKKLNNSMLKMWLNSSSPPVTARHTEEASKEPDQDQVVVVGKLVVELVLDD